MPFRRKGRAATSGFLNWTDTFRIPALHTSRSTPIRCTLPSGTGTVTVRRPAITSRPGALSPRADSAPASAPGSGNPAGANDAGGFTTA